MKRWSSFSILMLIWLLLASGCEETRTASEAPASDEEYLAGWCRFQYGATWGVFWVTLDEEFDEKLMREIAGSSREALDQLVPGKAPGDLTSWDEEHRTRMQSAIQALEDTPNDETWREFEEASRAVSNDAFPDAAGSRLREVAKEMEPCTGRTQVEGKGLTITVGGVEVPAF